MRKLIASPEVTARWGEPGALERMTIGATAAHLARAVLVVQQYMASPVPDDAPAPITASEYFAAALTPDLDDELHRGIRSRSDHAAAEGPDRVLVNLDAALAWAEATLPGLPVDTRVAVIGGTVMLLDEYLVTRVLELVVHLDDLAVSIDVPTPQVDPSAIDAVTGCLVGIARVRNGDLAVVRALARRERAPADVFPVL